MRGLKEVAERRRYSRVITAEKQTQSVVNSAVWREGKYLRSYDHRVLNMPEVKMFVQYSDDLTGRVLDLGCGAGRVLEYLVLIGADAHGIDISPAMVEHCRRSIPRAKLAVGDLLNLAAHVQGEFSAVLATDNVLDVFDDTERREVLRQIHDVLVPDGLLVFSSHDLSFIENPPAAYAGTDSSITLQKLIDKPVGDIIRSVVGRANAIGNRRRLAPFEHRYEDHAIINDRSHHYSLLHYYIRRDDQERQLNEHGFELVESLDTEGNRVEPGGTGPGDWLYYIARSKSGLPVHS